MTWRYKTEVFTELTHKHESVYMQEDFAHITSYSSGRDSFLCNRWIETYLDERSLAYLRLAPAVFREEREREREREHELLSQDAVSLGRWLIGNPHTEPSTSNVWFVIKFHLTEM